MFPTSKYPYLFFVEFPFHLLTASFGIMKYNLKSKVFQAYLPRWVVSINFINNKVARILRKSSNIFQNPLFGISHNKL